MVKMVKILYSPGFGPGWSTWNRGSPEFQKWMLTYQPLIEALERDEKLVPEELRFTMSDHIDRLHPALQQFVRDAKDKFGMERVCILGAAQLAVLEVGGPFRVDEYGGTETVVERANESWISI